MRRPRARGKLMALLASGGLLVVGSLLLRTRDEDLIQATDIQPPGRWHLQTSRLGDDADGEELARVLSLPYMSGSREASSQIGVTRFDPDRSLSGLNLYVSGHGPEVHLVDMHGQPVHRWRFPFEQAFPEKEPSIDTAYIRRAHVFPDGDLLAIYQGGGMVKIDRDSELVWKSDLPYYNHLYVNDDGTILSITKTARLVPELRPDRPVLEDAIVLLSAEGSVERRLSLQECFASSAFADSIHPLPDYADIFHTNTVYPISDSPGVSSEVFRPGFLIVSLREIDTVAVVDPVLATVAVAWRGPWDAQHQPVPLPSGNLLLFDNKGAETGSRVVEFDPLHEELGWVYPGAHHPPLSSPEAGSCQRLANGNTLITESETGRAVEVTTDGESVWEFFSPHRAGEAQELVATLFEVIRIPVADLPFAESAAAD